MAKAMNLPSVRSTQSHSSRPQIQACIGFPSADEISANVTAIHKAQILWDHGMRPKQRGYTLLIDEIALEERPRFDVSRDAVIGISRESASLCDLSPVTLESLHGIADGLQDRSITRAKEATVVSLAAFDGEHYSPIPILLSGTDKTETERPQSQILNLIIDTWDQSEHGQSFYGDIWSIASDGDATRRKALHRLFMCETLSPSDDLYHLLGGMPLMNLNCGKKARTLEIDFKHKFKSAFSIFIPEL